MMCRGTAGRRASAATSARTPRTGRTSTTWTAPHTRPLRIVGSTTSRRAPAPARLAAPAPGRATASEGCAKMDGGGRHQRRRHRSPNLTRPVALAHRALQSRRRGSRRGKRRRHDGFPGDRSGNQGYPRCRRALRQGNSLLLQLVAWIRCVEQEVLSREKTSSRFVSTFSYLEGWVC